MQVKHLLVVILVIGIAALIINKDKLHKIFNNLGQFLSEIAGTTPGQQFFYPYGIGVTGDRIVVADTGAGVLLEFNGKGDYLGSF